MTKRETTAVDAPSVGPSGTLSTSSHMLAGGSRPGRPVHANHGARTGEPVSIARVWQVVLRRGPAILVDGGPARSGESRPTSGRASSHSMFSAAGVASSMTPAAHCTTSPTASLSSTVNPASAAAAIARADTPRSTIVTTRDSLEKSPSRGLSHKRHTTARGFLSSGSPIPVTRSWWLVVAGWVRNAAEVMTKIRELGERDIVLRVAP
jgi:hypothetical protein